MPVQHPARPGGTSYDVARRAGVSQSAVSRAFRAGGSVAPATRARIMRVADEIGYRPNAMASSLITRRSGMVAVIISNLTNLHYPEVLAELTQRLSARGARVLLFALKSESEIDAVLDQVWRYQVDGAIVAARLSPAQLDAFRARKTALVLYNRRSHAVPVASVGCEFAVGEALLVDGLIASGCTRFAIIGGPRDSTVGEARLNTARDRLHAHGVTDIAVDRGDFGYDSGYAASLRLIPAYRPDAIISANDTMALGAIDAARLAFGLSIPQALSVVGFDGVGPATWRSYALTTIRQPVGRMTEAAVAMLFDRIERPTLEPEQRLFPGDLIVGQTARIA